MKKRVCSIFVSILCAMILPGCNNNNNSGEVEQGVLSSIEVDSSSKCDYEYGEEFVKPIVHAYYTNRTSKVVTELCQFSEFDPHKTQEQMIDISYTEGDITKETSWLVVVNPIPKTLVKIELAPGYKTSYQYGEPFEKPQVEAFFSDESHIDVTNEATYAGYDSSTTGDQTITVSYTYKTLTKSAIYDINVYEPETGVKFAIFADVQLTGKEDISGKSVTNQGNTANAPLALRNHLQFIKDNNIDTVLINGDLTNQANEYYYDYFEEILTDVYGEDESTYPEFVYNMGNHEWWNGTSEIETGTGVKMFKEHARIESDNLVRESEVKYSLDDTQTIPSYYKVINGIPFIVISGESADANIGDALYSELQSWLELANGLLSVKRGGPIFVEYHCPLSTSMTHGQGSNATNAGRVEALLANTPNAIVFTGDTHYPGINERSINQVDFTTINLGSSSYSRMVNASATVCDDYYNVVGTGSKIGDKLSGNVKFKEAYTPTIQVVEVGSDHTTKINRYFTENGGSARKVGEEWTINPIKSKEDFTYTNARFENKDASKALYGAEGLSWEETDTVTFGVNPTTHQMTVKFNDVANYHFCEHYQIKVNGMVYDFVSNYYKYLENKEENYFVIDDVADSTSYNVEVTAYDFYDNPSLNKLTSSTNDETICIDPVDNAFANSYSDIQKRNNLTETAPSSSSSTEVYYKGQNTYKYGAIVGRIYSTETNTQACNDVLSIKDNPNNIVPKLKMKVKNTSESDVTLGLSLVGKKNDGSRGWLADFDASTQKKVSPGSWTELEWDFSALCKWSALADIDQVTLKAKYNTAVSTGYEFSLLIDDLDIVGEEIGASRSLHHSTAGADYTIEHLDIAITEGASITVDFKVKGTGKISVMFGNWQHYLGYYDIYSNRTGDKYQGVEVVPTADGYLRCKFNFYQMTKVDNANNGDKSVLDTVSLMYVRGAWSSADADFEINPTYGEILRGESFAAGADYTKEFTSVDVATGSITFDVKFTSDADTKIAVILGNGWHNYFGYFNLYANTTTGAYNGLTVTKLNDGYIRYTFKLSEITLITQDSNPDKYLEMDVVNLFYIRGGWTTATGFVEFNPAQ